MDDNKQTIEREFSEKKQNNLVRIILIVIGVVVIFAVLIFFMIKIINNNSSVELNIDLNNENNDIVENVDELTQIQKFKDYDELKTFLENNSNGDYYGGGELLRANTMEDAVMNKMVTAAPGNAMSENSDVVGSDAGYSETNVQVQGVDEADIIKTDGDYIYAVSGNDLFIVDARDAEKSEVVSKIEFKNHPQNIYLNDDKLIIFGNDNSIYEEEIYSRFKRQPQYTFFKIFDISDKKNPQQLKDYDFEGHYSNSRMIGDYVYFLTNASTVNYTDDIPVPRVLLDGEEMYNYSDQKTCIGNCPEVYYVNDIDNSGYTMMNVMAINVNNSEDDNSFNHEVYLLPYNQNMYVSENNLYLTYTKHLDQQKFLTDLTLKIVKSDLNDIDQKKIETIQNTDNYILNDREKNRKIENILENHFSKLKEPERELLEIEIKSNLKKVYTEIIDKLEETVVHKIAIDKGNLEYKSFGSVPGTILNQFSMDENSDYFRIATTRNNNRWGIVAELMDENYFEEMNEENDKMMIREPQNESTNNLYTLDENLKRVGSLEGLAEGERIYSARFMGDRAYLVTFKQTDPLFVIDLQNPKEPKVLGELKIPGFSNYLHPYDKNHLIGIGKDTEENEFGGVVTKGLKIALFDVSDVENPKEKAKYILGGKGSDSIALRDHKAFLFDKEQNLMVLPVTLRDYDNDVPIPALMIDDQEDSISPENDKELAMRRIKNRHFVGAAVFEITDELIDLRGKISHSRNSDDDWCLGECYNDNILRSLWIGDVLYTFSNKFLQSNKISDLKEIEKLELRKEKEDDFEVVN